MENALTFYIEKFRAVNVVRDRQVIEVYVEENESINKFCKFVKYNFPLDAEVDEIKIIEDYTGYVPKLETFALVYYSWD